MWARHVFACSSFVSPPHAPWQDQSFAAVQGETLTSSEQLGLQIPYPLLNEHVQTRYLLNELQTQDKQSRV